MTQLVLLLEEPSAKDLLEGLLPRILPPDIAPLYLVFQGKQDLERNITRKLRAWLAPNSRFVVMRDQDAGECRAVKQRLVERVEASGRRGVLVRVACRDLESWVLGDWAALAAAFGKPSLAHLAERANFRDPDSVVNGLEELRRHIPDYQKRDGARRVGPFLDPSTNRSTSFKQFCSGLERLLAGRT